MKIQKTAAAVLVMLLAVMLATIVRGEATQHTPAALQRTNALECVVDTLVIAGKLAKDGDYSHEKEQEMVEESTCDDEQIRNYYDDFCENPTECAVLLPDPEVYQNEEYILRVLTAEGGTDQLVCNGVTQCLYNACRRDGWQHSVAEILLEYQYTGPADWISDEARNAWDAVFFSGVTFTDFGDALYFYAPRYCDSPWHESQRFVIEVGGVRFFTRWN